MNKRLINVLLASAFALAISLPLASIAAPPKPAKTPAAAALNATQERTEPREAHPEINRAIRQLQAAKAGLEKYGAHDLGGHRVKAIEHIDQALAELREGIKFDKK
ncbi:MAG TPA: hypothetical protein VGT03_01815 [Candidatus Acidoferrales bacterium]|nr:hypothetical protein [Candidatus Acidoferrales bacterium]